MTTSEALDAFYALWAGKRIHDRDEYMIYAVVFGRSKENAERANKLIGALKLPLIAVPHSKHGLFYDTIKIKGI